MNITLFFSSSAAFPEQGVCSVRTVDILENGETAKSINFTRKVEGTEEATANERIVWHGSKEALCNERAAEIKKAFAHFEW